MEKAFCSIETAFFLRHAPARAHTLACLSESYIAKRSLDTPALKVISSFAAADKVCNAAPAPVSLDDWIAF